MSKWFECPVCGSEYWQPKVRISGEGCDVCQSVEAQEFLCKVRAGTSDAPEWWRRLEDILDGVRV